MKVIWIFYYLMKKKVDRSVKEALLRSADRKHRLWFCVSIHHTEMVAEKLKELGFNCAYITGDTSIKEREHIFQEFEKGIITDIVNCDTLTTGTDIPCIDCLIMLRPTKMLVHTNYWRSKTHELNLIINIARILKITINNYLTIM